VRGVGAFLKVFDDIKLAEDTHGFWLAPHLPTCMVIDEDRLQNI